MRESLYTRINVWVINILNHTNTRIILPRYEGSYMVYKLKWDNKPKIKYLYSIGLYIYVCVNKHIGCDERVWGEDHHTLRQ